MRKTETSPASGAGGRAGIRLVLLTGRGLAADLVDELRRRFDLEGRPHRRACESWVVAEVESLERAAEVVYRSRVAQRVLVVLAAGGMRRDARGLDDLHELVCGAGLEPWLEPKTRFGVRCERKGEHAFTSQEAAARAGAAVIERLGETARFRPEVDLDDPDLVLRLEILDDHALLGADLSGRGSLHRRGYQVRAHRAGLKPTLAHALLRRGGWRPGQELLDPMCGGGTIVLEAGLEAAGVPAGFHRKSFFPWRRLPPFRSVEIERLFARCDAEIDRGRVRDLVGADISSRTLDAARANARAAGLEGGIEWVRAAIGELPGSLGGRRFRRVVSNPPYGLKMGTPEQVEATYRRLFRTLERVLEPGGTCTLVTTRIRQVFALAARHGFEARRGTVWVADRRAGSFVLRAAG